MVSLYVYKITYSKVLSIYLSIYVTFKTCVYISYSTIRANLIKLTRMFSKFSYQNHQVI